MKVRFEYLDKILIFRIEGRIDSSNSALLESELNKAMDERTQHLVLDLQKLEYMSSSGVRVLLTTHMQIYQKGGEMVIAHAPLFAYKIFQNSGFENLCQLFDTTEDAINYLRNLTKSK